MTNHTEKNSTVPNDTIVEAAFDHYDRLGNVAGVSASQVNEQWYLIVMFENEKLPSLPAKEREFQGYKVQVSHAVFEAL